MFGIKITKGERRRRRYVMSSIAGVGGISDGRFDLLGLRI
jgi:hypothetical protein